MIVYTWFTVIVMYQTKVEYQTKFHTLWKTLTCNYSRTFLVIAKFKEIANIQLQIFFSTWIINLLQFFMFLYVIFHCLLNWLIMPIVKLMVQWVIILFHDKLELFDHRKNYIFQFHIKGVFFTVIWVVQLVKCLT